ncbi:MAG: arginine--tRNA ligase [Candidatus Sumerlaeota bacterium]|nr:arginine--tRNA ligase [Candidatus Sumerlaeota bacterium]
MDFKRALEEQLAQAAGRLCEKQGAAAFAGAVQVVPPKSREHGDYATNLALQLSKTLRRPPIEIARDLVEELKGVDFLEGAEAVAPGFVNFRLRVAASGNILRGILEKGAAFGRSEMGQGEKVMVEFVSANPTGPLHIGHARNAVVGDCAARLLEATGHAVTREYYFNDAGVQMDTLGRSLHARYLQALGQDEPLPENGYQGPYMVDIAQELKSHGGIFHADAFLHGKAGGEEPNPYLHAYEESLREFDGRPIADLDTPFFTRFAASRILQTIDKDLRDMRIRFDVWFSESSLYRDGSVDRALEKLKSLGQIYEKDGAWWLRSEQFGDEKDRVVIKSDGAKTYVTPDLAYHENKFQRGFHRAIDVLGGDHHGYVPRLRAGVQNLGHNADQIQFVIIQMVTLLKDNERIKISTRRGDFLPLSHAIAELGVDAVRFFMVMRSADAQMNFDWNLAKSQSMENPVYYVQYAHARCASLFQKAAEEGVEWKGPEGADLGRLTIEEERALIQALGRYPEVVESAARALEPQHIANYLMELAQTFNAWFTRGTRDKSLRFVVPDDPALTQARLCLIAALKTVLANALGLIGVSAPDEM